MIKDTISKFDIYFSWIAAILAMLGSLYFSEILNFVPCTLCWYQRILMYPLVVILGISIFKKDYNASIYALPFSILGMFFSLYHYLLQKSSIFSEIHICNTGIPCNAEYINLLGFITIPLLALIAFTFISSMLVLGRIYRKPSKIYSEKIQTYI